MGGIDQTRLMRRFAIFISAFVVLSMTSEAWAWGPATHVMLATNILQHVWMLPAAIAAIIVRHRRHFVYGNVATDTVFAKKMSSVKQICHRWDTGFSLLEKAETDAGRAFAYGYLAHLAADTIAHNKFLPRQMAVSRSTISFGHLYWEIRADSCIDQHYWQRLRRALRGSYPEPEVLLAAHLRKTILSYRTNRVLFKQMNLLASESAWRRSVDFWQRLSRFSLNPSMLARYHDESRERAIDVLTKTRRSRVLDEDPNGNLSLGYARAQRRQLRQLKRAGVPHAQIIREAAIGHAPDSRERTSAAEETETVAVR